MRRAAVRWAPPLSGHDQALPDAPCKRSSNGSVAGELASGGAQKQMSARRPSAPPRTVMTRRPSRSKRGSEHSTEAKEIPFTAGSLPAQAAGSAFRAAAVAVADKSLGQHSRAFPCRPARPRVARLRLAFRNRLR